MDKQSKLQGALGLSRRAGKCVAGDFAVERAIKAGKVGLVVLDSDASEATRKRYQTYCGSRGIKLLEISGMGRMIGKPDGKIAGITDQRFIHMICSAASGNDEKDLDETNK